MDGITLKVSPSELKSKAEEIQNQINSFEIAWNRIVQLINNSKGYWVGDAGNAHQKQFEQYKNDVERIIKRLHEHPDDLLKMAGVYEESERRAVEKTQTLSGNVIS